MKYLWKAAVSFISLNGSDFLRPYWPVASKELPGAEQKLPGQDKFLSALPRPQAGPFAVEKLTRRKMAEKTLH
jgi:hypothetical protein